MHFNRLTGTRALYRALCAGLIVLATALRFYDLAGGSVWYDEAVASLNSLGAFTDVLSNTRVGNSSPILYPALLRAVQLADISAFSIRAVPAAASVLTVASMLWLLPRVGVNRWVAFAAALLATLSVEAIRNAQDAREYSLDAFVAVLMTAGLLLFNGKHGVIKRNALLCGSLFIAPLVQYGLVLFGAAVLATAAILRAQSLRGADLAPRKALRALAELTLPASCFALGCALSYAVTLRYQWQMGGFAADGRLSSNYYAGRLSDPLEAIWFASSRTWDLFHYHLPAIAAALAIAVFAAALIASFARRKADPLLTLFLISVCVAVAAAITRAYPYGGIRQVLWMGPILYLAAGQSLHSLISGARPSTRILAVAPAALLTLPAALYAFTNDNPYGEYENAQGVLAALDEGMRDGDFVYVYVTAAPSIRFYRGEEPDGYHYGICGLASRIDECARDVVRALPSPNSRAWIVNTRGGHRWETLEFAREGVRVRRVFDDEPASLHLIENPGSLSSLNFDPYARPPSAATDFEVSLDRSLLLYRKEQCRLDEAGVKFFLHVFPQNVGDLPLSRLPYGFDNLNFHFHSYGVVVDGECIASRPLPAYPIDRVETGQFQGSERLWTKWLALER